MSLPCCQLITPFRRPLQSPVDEFPHSYGKPGIIASTSAARGSSQFTEMEDALATFLITKKITKLQNLLASNVCKGKMNTSHSGNRGNSGYIAQSGRIRKPLLYPFELRERPDRETLASRPRFSSRVTGFQCRASR